ncbi:hypothetical protein [Planctomycetes bacterium Pan216]|uniref:hypothetical protein n=1 Tax=Kolteria novifilia TaxID=2527975 RepID=UPI0011A63D1C
MLFLPVVLLPVVMLAVIPASAMMTSMLSAVIVSVTAFLFAAILVPTVLAAVILAMTVMTSELMASIVVTTTGASPAAIVVSTSVIVPVTTIARCPLAAILRLLIAIAFGPVASRAPHPRRRSLAVRSTFVSITSFWRLSHRRGGDDRRQTSYCQEPHPSRHRCAPFGYVLTWPLFPTPTTVGLFFTIPWRSMVMSCRVPHLHQPCC